MRFIECNRQEPNIPATALPKLRPLIPNPLPNTFSTLSTRWNPTPEQLQALEEMYGRGIRAPSAQQIQQITGKLRGFGKIEGKNVFYWFQNHKARERQRKRRQMAGGKRQPGRRYSEAKHLLQLQTPTVSECSAVVQECEEGDNCRQWNCRELERSCWPLEVLSSCIEAVQENGRNEFSVAGNGNGNHQTLELFPVEANMQQEKGCFAPKKPNQFFEFLPTKITEGLSL